LSYDSTSQIGGSGLCSASFFSLRSETNDDDIRLLKHEKKWSVGRASVNNNRELLSNHCCRGIPTMHFLCIVIDLHVFSWKNYVGNVRISNNIGLSRNHCCCGIPTIHFLCIVMELHVFSWKKYVGSLRISNNKAHSPKYCCRGISTMRLLSTVVDLHASLLIYIKQLDALNFLISLFHASTCFEHMCSSSGGQNCTIQSLVSSHL